jgi:hypothetical protein
MRFRSTWKREWTWILTAFLLLRLIYTFLGAMAVSQGLPVPLDENEITLKLMNTLHSDPVSQAVVNVWLRWDTAWYLKIAASGYAVNDGSIAFMPLYPWLMRVTGELFGGNLLLGGIIVSNLAGLIVCILLFELTRLERNFKTNPFQTVLALLVFPSAFFLFAVYSESLFLMLMLASWLSARHKRWLVAGILGGLATLCRLQGILLIPVMAWLFMAAAAGAEGLPPKDQIRTVWRMLTERDEGYKKRVSMLRPAGLAVFLPGLSLMAYQVWSSYSKLGSIFDVHSASWHIRTVMPWEGFKLFITRLFSQQRVFIDYIDLGLLLIIVGICIYAMFRLDPAYSIYSWLNLSLFFMRGTPPHLLDGFNRFLLMIFPAFLVLGALRNRLLVIILGSLSFIVQLFLVMGFLDWRWVA